MKILHVAQRYRSGTMGLFFAGLGFTYALATSSGGTNTLSYNAASRAIGTTCPRPPTQFVTPSDLGLVVQGSNYSRQILVRFGIGPHNFLIFANDTSIPVSLFPNGEVIGVPANAGRVDFTVVAQDFSTVKPVPSVARDFFFNVVPNSTSTSPLPLTIVNGPDLPPAVTGEPYNFTIQANGGFPPYTYELADDASQQALPDGLALGEDGKLFGSPTIVPLTSSPFTVIATDFDGFSVKQSFTLPVLQGPIQTDVIASNGNFHFSFGRDGSHDGVKLTLILNKDDLGTSNIRTKADLKGIPFGLRIGGVTLPPGFAVITGTGTDTSTSTTSSSFANIFNDKGQFQFPVPISQGGTFTFPKPKNQPSYKVTLDPKTGILNVNFNGISLVKGLGGNFRTFRSVIPVEVLLGTGVSSLNNTGATSTATATSTSTDTSTGTSGIPTVFYDRISLVKFDYRRSSTIGKGTTNKRDISTPGGQFLVTKFAGTEKKGSGNFDVVTLKFSGFLRLPGGKPLVPGPADIVSITVGGTPNSCIGSFPASSMETHGDVLTFTNNDTTVPLHTITIDNKKGTFYVDTNSVEAFRIFAQDTLLSGEPQKLPILVSFSSPDGATVTLDAISSVTVFRRGTKLQNK